MQRIPDTNGKAAVTTKRKEVPMPDTQIQGTDPKTIDPHTVEVEPPLTPEEEEELADPEEKVKTYDVLLEEIDGVIDEYLDGEIAPFTPMRPETFFDEPYRENIPDDVQHRAIYAVAEVLWGEPYDGDPRDHFAWRTCLEESAKAVFTCWDEINEAHWDQVDEEIAWLQRIAIVRPRFTRVKALRTWRCGRGYVDEHCRRTVILSTPWTGGVVVHLWQSRKAVQKRLAELDSNTW